MVFDRAFEAPEFANATSMQSIAGRISRCRRFDVMLGVSNTWRDHRVGLVSVAGPHQHAWIVEESLVNRKQSLTSIGQPVPELPVSDVERAQQHYRDALGFEIGWLHQGEIGAVSRGNVAIFFRKTTPPFEAAVHWVFAENIDATYDELRSLGASIVEPLERKPWGLRQFTVEDIDGNRFYFHHD